MVGKARFLQALLCHPAAPWRSQQHQQCQEAAHPIEGNQEVDSGPQDGREHPVSVQAEQVPPEQPYQRGPGEVQRQQQPLIWRGFHRRKSGLDAPEQMAVFRPLVDIVFFGSGHRESPPFL